MFTATRPFGVYTILKTSIQDSLVPVSDPSHWLFTYKGGHFETVTLPTGKLQMLIQSTDDYSVTMSYLHKKFKSVGWTLARISDCSVKATKVVDQVYDDELRRWVPSPRLFHAERIICVYPFEQFSVL